MKKACIGKYPEWVEKAVFYQIFPDRFCKSAKYKPVGRFVEWNSKPSRENMFGGNLAGIIDKLNYISSLGVNAIYLCPIFKSNSNHRYHTIDYFEIDPVLGSLKDFDKLIKKAHQMGIRVILDGVFNHCSRGFFQFNSLLELGENSPYVDWFYIHSFPLHAYSGKPNYECWWNYPALPKFNTQNEEVREYLFRVGEYWIKRGIDGWRLDVPNEIDDDSFWQEFRVRVKKINPNAYIVGEIWNNPSRWLQGDEFDGVMNYPFRKSLISYLFEKKIDLETFYNELLNVFPNSRFGIPMNLLGSHDTIRIASQPNVSENRIKLAYTLLFFLPGAPCIYYGDEISLEGGKDPDCRRSFPWDNLKKLKSTPLFSHVKGLIHLRIKEKALQRGSLEISFKGKVLEITRNLNRIKLVLRVFDENNGSEPYYNITKE